MTTILSVSQARRRLRRLIALVVQGHTFVLTKNGKEMCRLVSTEEKTRTH